MAEEQPTIQEIRRAVPRVVEAIATVPWAITDEMMDTIVAIASRANDATPEALEAYRARHLANSENAGIRGSVGILTVRGPIFRYADMFTAFSGGTTYEGMVQDLQALDDNPAIRSAVAWFDSPGGEVNGCSEAAEVIRNFSKPIVAYVGGQACSAAYWLASACDEIVVSDTAVLGSIGVRMSLRDTKLRDEKSGVRTFEFISSRAPNKRTEPETDEGRARIQRTADALEGVFVSAVARYRGVSEDDVVANFGGGGVEIGADAVSVGLADKLGSFEGVIAKMQAGQFRQSSVRRNIHMATTPNAPAATNDQPVTYTQAQVDAMVSAARQEGASAGSTEAAARLSAILGCDEAKDRPKLAAHYAYKTTMSADDAKAALAVAGKETVETPAPAPAATTTTPAAPAQGRAQDAAGGLALAGLNAPADEPEKKTAAIDSRSIYKGRREVVAAANR